MGIKINKSYENSINDCTLVNTQEVVTSWDDKSGESVISWLAHSKFSVDTASGSFNIPEYIRYLDAKLTAVRKTASFWDAYSIRESVTTADEFAQKYASLPNNSALVINTGTIIFNNKTYNRGDIVIKDNYGNEVDVSNQLNGVYIPVKFEDKGNGNLQVVFEFRNEKALKDPKLSIPPTVKPAEGSLYSNIIYWPDDTTKYEVHIAKKPEAKIEGKDVLPFWECRVINDDDTIGDKIFDLVTVAQNSTEWVFKFPSDLSSTFKFVLIIK